MNYLDLDVDGASPSSPSSSRNHNNDRHNDGDANYYSRPVRPQRQRPLHLNISKERLRRSIANWEKILTCSKCHVLQQSLDDLFEHPDHPRPICTVCKDDEVNRSTWLSPRPVTGQPLEEQPSQVYPLSYLIRCGVPKENSRSYEFLSNDDATRGPATLLKQMKLLLTMVENESSKDNRHKQDECCISIRQDDRQQSRQSDAMPSKTKSSAEWGRRSYASMDPNFLPQPPRTLEVATASDDRHERHEEGFRYRKGGGQIYDPKHNKKRLSATKRKAFTSNHGNNDNNNVNNNNRCEFDFPDSPPPREEEDEQCEFDCTNSLEHGDETKHTEQPSHDSMETGVNKATSGMEKTFPRHDEDDPDISADGGPRSDRKMRTNSQLPEPTDTTALSETVDPGRFSSAHYDMANQSSSLPPQSIDTAALPQTADFEQIKSSQSEWTHSNSSQLPGSIRTAALPQTADFGRFPSQEPLPSSIDTADLPQTADFGRFPMLGALGRGSHPQEPQQLLLRKSTVDHAHSGENMVHCMTVGRERDESLVADSKIDGEFGNDPTYTNNVVERLLESQPPSIDTDFLAQTDVNKPFRCPYRSSLEEPRETKLHETKSDFISERSSECHLRTDDPLRRMGPNYIRKEGGTTQSLSVKTPGPSKPSNSTRRITPPSLSMSERAKSWPEILTLVLHEKLCPHDEELVRTLKRLGICTVSTIDHDTIESLPNGDGTVLIFDAASVKLAANPFMDDGGLITICDQSFEYLVARILGLRLLTSECLGELQRGPTTLVDYTVWGDSQLYKIVTRDHNVYPWHETASWWGDPVVSPSESSIRRWKGNGRPILSSLSILVAREDVEEEKRRIESDKELLSRFVREGKDDFRGENIQFQGLCGDEIECLCRIGGAHVATSLLSASQWKGATEWIVLVPDSLDDEEAFFRNLADRRVIPRESIEINIKPTKRDVQFVYFSWLVDTICADTIAPLDNYIVDYFQKNQTLRDNNFVNESLVE